LAHSISSGSSTERVQVSSSLPSTTPAFWDSPSSRANEQLLGKLRKSSEAGETKATGRYGYPHRIINGGDRRIWRRMTKHFGTVIEGMAIGMGIAYPVSVFAPELSVGWACSRSRWARPTTIAPSLLSFPFRPCYSSFQTPFHPKEGALISLSSSLSRES
jgi:hypothetical protein